MTREHVSLSQFCELLAIPSTLCGVELDRAGITLVFQEEPVAQTSGVIPQLNQGGKTMGKGKGKGKGSGKRGC